MARTDRFASRWGLILAALGMAIGTGNIWRFPRIIAANGGGTFLIPWLIFLFSWSIPLLIVESAMGKKARRGTIGAFTTLLGGKSAWKGAFIGFCTIAIGFYYCVIAGWCTFYLAASVTGRVQGQDTQVYWDSFSSNGVLQVLFLLIALSICAAIIWRGVSAGIEKVNKILIPSLFVILVIAALRAVTLDGAGAGMEYLFTFRLSDLGNHRIWLEALTQSAWSTGAGYGLLLTYAVYMRQKQNIVFSAVTTGLGNNAASLLAAIALIPTVFAVRPQEALEIVQQSGPASTGMAFIYFPRLLEEVPGGGIIMPLFFLGLTFAAVSSMIAMFELGVRNFSDYGIARHKSIGIVFICTLLLGTPSALSLTFLTNQDWVWGLGLMVSGFFFATAARQIGGRKFRDEWVNTTTGWKIGKGFTWIVFWLIPLQFVAMLGWWFYQAIFPAGVYDDGWWNPISNFSLGTVLAQWLVVIAIFLILNPALARQKGEAS